MERKFGWTYDEARSVYNVLHKTGRIVTLLDLHIKVKGSRGPRGHQIHELFSRAIYGTGISRAQALQSTIDAWIALNEDNAWDLAEELAGKNLRDELMILADFLHSSTGNDLYLTPSVIDFIIDSWIKMYTTVCNTIGYNNLNAIQAFQELTLLHQDLVAHTNTKLSDRVQRIGSSPTVYTRHILTRWVEIQRILFQNQISGGRFTYDAAGNSYLYLPWLTAYAYKMIRGTWEPLTQFNVFYASFFDTTAQADFNWIIF
ncbi:MAG: hypothetical protein ACFFCS_24825, partial [Candidatus Hodarchaeota archaeon]